MIPALIAFAAGYMIGDSVVSMSKASAYSDYAKELDTEAVALVDKVNDRVNSTKKDMLVALDTLGKTKIALMSGNIMKIAEAMTKVHNNFKLNNDTEGLRELRAKGFRQSVLSEVTEYSNKALALINAESKCSRTSEIEAYGTGLVGGAVIALGYITASPFLFLYARSKVEDAEAAIYEAATKLEQAQVYVEKMENVRELFKAIDSRARQLNHILIGLNRHLDPAVAEVSLTQKTFGNNLRNYPLAERHNLFFAWQLTQTIKIIIDTSMIKEDWSLNPDMDRPLSNGQTVLALLG